MYIDKRCFKNHVYKVHKGKVFHGGGGDKRKWGLDLGGDVSKKMSFMKVENGSN